MTQKSPSDGERRNNTSSRRRRTGPISPLMIRIMAVNVIAIAMLVAGIFYLDKFRDRLIEQRHDTLTVQAEIIAGAIGEAASGGEDSTAVDIETAEQIIGRLIGPTETRARLFTLDGQVAVDSRFMALGRSVYIVPLPPPGTEPDWQERLLTWLNKSLDAIASNPDYPPYVERPNQDAADFNEVQIALTGETATQIHTSDNGLIIATAVPIQRFRRVLGALLLTSETNDIQVIIEQERLTILKVMGVTLLATITLSFFLASTIATPIKRLASAADEVRRGIGRSNALRKFSNRNDEIGDLSHALSDMTKALHERIDAIESFAADVAHEIKNPLTSVKSAVETASKNKNPEVQEKLLKIIEDDTRRIDRLISDISEASRLDAELSRAEADNVNLYTMIESIIDAYRSTARNSQPKLILKKESEKIVVRGIASRLGQVVRNLIDNAISFTPSDGEINIILAQSKGLVTITVIDDGIGLPEGVGDKIFERFYSERPETEAFGKHSGLGLNICKQIIEAHGGSIQATNKTHKTDIGTMKTGAIFRVTLPALQ